MNIKPILNHENIKCDILKKEYKALSVLLSKLQKVIINNENILLFSKNQCMKLLNDLIKKLNENYNNSIIEIYSHDNFNDDNNIDNQAILKNDSLYGDISELKNEISEQNSENNSSNENINYKNVVITSEASKVNILLKENEGKLELIYLDNGIGFDTAIGSSSFGSELLSVLLKKIGSDTKITGQNGFNLTSKLNIQFFFIVTK